MDIDNQIKEALLSGDKTRLSVLRLIKSEFTRNDTKAENDPTRKSHLDIIIKLRNSLKTMIEAASKTGNQEALEDNTNQLEIVEEFVPKEPKKEEIEEVVKGLIDSLDHPKSMKDMGAIMAELKKKFAVINGNVASSIVKSALLA